MKLTDVQIRLRPRLTPEAIDLGLHMTRRWWPLLMLAWTVQSLPVLLFGLWVFDDMPALAALLVWWLKPWYEVTQLHILSRAIFGEQPSLRQALGAWREIGFKRLLLALTLRRFDMQRSFNLPVSQLEGLTGSVRRQRLAALRRMDGAQATGITIMCSMIESCLLFGLAMTVFTLVPREQWSDFSDFMFADQYSFLLGQNIVYWLAIGLVGPFYVGAGFAMYLNQRAWLEGWDIEVAFRRLHARVAPALVRFLLVALCMAGVSTPSSAWAESVRAITEEQQLHDMADADWRINNVLADPVFHNVRSIWIPKGWTWDADEDESKRQPWLDPDTLLMIARGFVVAIWVLATGLALYLVWRYRHVLPLLGQFEAPWKKRRVKPVQLFDLDISPESLPDDIAGMALALWQQQRQREALSLLYRGSLSRLVHEHELDLRESATEGEALRLVQRRRLPVITDYFAQLTLAWQQLAYAHRHPDEHNGQHLCRGWSPAFEPQKHTESVT